MPVDENRHPLHGNQALADHFPHGRQKRLNPFFLVNKLDHDRQVGRNIDEAGGMNAAVRSKNLIP